MAWKPLSFGLTLLLALGSGANAANASRFKDCVAIIAMSDFASKKAFHAGLADLIARERPEFASLASLHMRLQVALARSRRMRLSYILRADPDRLNTGHGMSRFANFDWNSSDTFRLAETNIRFEAISAEISRLKVQNNGHPEWPALRRFFTNELTLHPEYRTLLAEMLREREMAAERLKDCRAT